MISFKNHHVLTLSVILGLATACSSGKSEGGGSSPTSSESAPTSQGSTPVSVTPGTPSTPTPAPTPATPMPTTPIIPQDPTIQNPPVTVTPSNPGVPAAPTNPPDCVPVSSMTGLTKILFLVDTSGSNAGFLGLGATDAHKKFRLGSIQNFFQRYQGKSNFEWGFMTFSGNHATDFVGNDGEDSFATNPQKMQRALNHFSKIQDHGNTPYLAAFDHVINALEKDKDLKSSKNPQYYIILFSDGVPTDAKDMTEINTKIRLLLGTDSGRVHLSTVYYGHRHDPQDTEGLLKTIAKEGDGIFINAEEPQSTINIDELIPHSQNNCH